MKNEVLIESAITAMKNAYAPYSNYIVGAALLSQRGKIYTGCNIENSSYGVTNCAERTAFFKAISNGEKEFIKIALVAGKNGVITDYANPCGMCLQVMQEFCNSDFEIILAKSANEYRTMFLSDLLPHRFDSSNLGG